VALLAANPAAAEGFGLFGVVKEVGVDDGGLRSFSEQHLGGWDLYLDEDLGLYGALGSRSIASQVEWAWAIAHPRQAWKFLKDIGTRQKERNIENNMVGEGSVLGGILVFDAVGALRYAYLERTGREIPGDEIVAALRMVKGMEVAEKDPVAVGY
jgi:hypothetical protein